MASGRLERRGRPAGWEQVLGLAELVASVLGVELTRRAGSAAPWHPGRCAELVVQGVVVGYAGELHPQSIKAYALPARAAALELDLDALMGLLGGPGSIAAVSSHPVAKEDVALVVDESVPVADRRGAVVVGAGALLESVRLFDIYRGAPVPAGRSRSRSRCASAPPTARSPSRGGAARDAAVARGRIRRGEPDGLRAE